ncbi:MAG: hypothetical protein ACRYGK_00915 [Janthinobacterium lividum]
MIHPQANRTLITFARFDLLQFFNIQHARIAVFQARSWKNAANAASAAMVRCWLRHHAVGNDAHGNDEMQH